MALVKLFNIGDEVCFLNERGGGVVIKINNRTSLSIQLQSGLIIPYLINELVLIKAAVIHKEEPKIEPETINAASKLNLAQLIYEKRKSTQPKAVSKKHNKNSGSLTQEIDLHIDLLLNNYKGMSNAAIIMVQLKHFETCLDAAIYGNAEKITFIHGVGNGRLKYEIRQILSTYNNIAFYDAPYKRYGFGATEVMINHNKRN